MNLIAEFMGVVPPEGRILDLGAGGGEYASALASQGFRVCAVDCVSSRLPLCERIEWFNIDFRDCSKLPNFDCDALFCRNVLHYYETDWVANVLFPALRGRMPSLRFAYIKAFSSSPQPAFEVEFSSYWDESSLSSLLVDFDVRFFKSESEFSPDVAGVWRNFSCVEIVLIKSSE